jgi:predicted RNase H-like HicB family nuclease
MAGALSGGTLTTKSALYRLTAAITQEGPWYVARCLEVEVTSQGASIEEALANLQEALELYFEDGSPPESMIGPIIAPVEVRVGGSTRPGRSSRASRPSKHSSAPGSSKWASAAVTSSFGTRTGEPSLCPCTESLPKARSARF